MLKLGSVKLFDISKAKIRLKYDFSCLSWYSSCLCHWFHIAVKKIIGEMCIKTERELRNTQLKKKEFDDK